MTKVLPKRHLAKAITYRVLSTILTILLAFIFTKDINLSLQFGVVEVAVKIVFYYLHERVWYKYSHFGVKENGKEKELDKNK